MVWWKARQVHSLRPRSQLRGLSELARNLLLSAKLVPTFAYRESRGQCDGSLRPYSRFPRPEYIQGCTVICKSKIHLSLSLIVAHFSKEVYIYIHIFSNVMCSERPLQLFPHIAPSSVTEGRKELFPSKRDKSKPWRRAKKLSNWKMDLYVDGDNI
jgi:hypothetical protein